LTQHKNLLYHDVMCILVTLGFLKQLRNACYVVPKPAVQSKNVGTSLDCHASKLCFFAASCCKRSCQRVTSIFDCDLGNRQKRLLIRQSNLPPRALRAESMVCGIQNSEYISSAICSGIITYLSVLRLKNYLESMVL
jgi:hypothetical protein